MPILKPLIPAHLSPDEREIWVATWAASFVRSRDSRRAPQQTAPTAAQFSMEVADGAVASLREVRGRS